MDLEEIIKARRSTRSFSSGVPPESEIKKILESAVYAPYGGATGIPLDEIRKIYVFRQHTTDMDIVYSLFHEGFKKNARTFRILLRVLPFMRKKYKAFSNRLNIFAQKGIPALSQAPFIIVIAEKKGFPPIEKQSMAHALENMWLTATSLGLGFQLISATGNMAKNKDFMKLLGLEYGEYAVEGCAIGYPKKVTERTRDLDIDSFVTWMK